MAKSLKGGTDDTCVQTTCSVVDENPECLFSSIENEEGAALSTWTLSVYRLLHGYEETKWP